MKKTILAFSCIFTCFIASAQTKWNLRQCIDYAIENNTEVKQQEISVEKAKNNLSTSKNSRLPDLNASVNYGFSFNQSKKSNTVIGDQVYSNSNPNYSRATFGIQTSIPVFTGFRIPNENKRNNLNLQAATEGLKKIKENKEVQITGYYLEVLFQKEILKVYQEQIRLSKEQVDKTEILVSTGKVAQAQLYDIKAQLAKDELNATNANNSLIQSLLDLSQALNLNNFEDFDIVEPSMDNFIRTNQASLLSPRDIYNIALNIKPHVKEAELYLQSSKYALNISKADYYPTISLSSGYNTSTQRLYGLNNNPFHKQWKDNAVEYITFSLNIPIFNRFATRNNVRAARLEIYNREVELYNVTMNLYKEIQQAYQNAIASQAKYISAEKSFEAASKSFDYTQERYNVGKSTVFELNESQTKLFTSQSEQLQAKYDFVFRTKILDFYQGKEINID